MNILTCVFTIIALISISSQSIYAEEPVNISTYLQDISVTIKTERGSGSGVIFSREIKSDDGKKNVNFVWKSHVKQGQM